MALACILCFSSCRTTFNPFFLTPYLCSVSQYFSFFLISPRFFLSKMLICFCNSCTNCFILLFQHGSFTEFLLLCFGLRPTFFPSKMTHALINLLVSVIFNFCQKIIYFHCPVFEQIPIYFLNPIQDGPFRGCSRMGNREKGPPP